MTHDDNEDRLIAGDDPLVSLFGYHLSVNEAHAVGLGLVGLLVGERGMVVSTILREPHYFLGAFLAAYLVGRHYRETAHEHEHDGDLEIDLGAMSGAPSRR